MACHYRLLLEYDGTDYVGWQWQPNGTSVQGVLEEALRKVLGGEEVHVVASGRTDAGVHALGQVVGFRARSWREPEALRMGLNSLLPRDVACRCADVAPPDFHAQRSALSKRYRYRILDTGERSPLRDRQVLHLRGPLDEQAMRRAAALLVGTHDFTSFRATGSSARSSVRTLSEVAVLRRGDELHVEVEGSGFLRHMVRILVGTLIEVGSGARTPESVAEVLEARDRRAAGRTAPACGLCLLRVRYDPPWPEPPPPDPLLWAGGQ